MRLGPVLLRKNGNVFSFFTNFSSFYAMFYAFISYDKYMIERLAGMACVWDGLLNPALPLLVHRRCIK